MPRPGKSGKGLSKRSTKPHWKVLLKNVQGITKPAIRHLAHRSCVKRISGLVYEETRAVLEVSGECDPQCGDLRGARQMQAGHGHGCGVWAEMPGPHAASPAELSLRLTSRLQKAVFKPLPPPSPQKKSKLLLI